MFVLGTAGHVDHGKSSFLRTITGMEPDRLPEEKKRGLTINLNFLWSEISSFGTVGFVDVPGHHRFVGNMISGVGEISGFILLVAADDGWMPQTEEHVQILKSFGIQRGLVVISKTDLVSAEELAVVETEVTKKTKAYFGTALPVAHFSKNETSSHEQCKTAIENLLRTLSPPKDRNSARLYVDRCFLAQGKGVIATGTLIEGCLTTGQNLHLWPGQKKVHLRSLQSYQAPLEKVKPVTRVALQLSQTEFEDLAPEFLLSGDEVFTTAKCDVRMEAFGEPLKKNTHLKVFWGTFEKEALFVPGLDPTLGRLQFAEPVPLRFGDLFVLRTAGGEKLLAGGWVADPKARSKNKKEAQTLLANLKNDLVSFLKMEIYFEGVLDAEELFLRSSWDKESLLKALEAPIYEKISSGETLLKSEKEGLKNKILENLKKKSPLTYKELAQGFDPRRRQHFLETIIKEGLEKKWWEGTVQEIVLLRSETPLNPDQQKLLKLFQSQNGILSGDEIAKAISVGNPKSDPKKILNELVKRKELVALKDDLFCSPVLLKGYEEKVTMFLKAHGQATSSQLKEVLGGLSRKYAIPLLEKMDQNRLTYLKDGVRKLLK